MSHEILIGREISINGKSIKVHSIKREVDSNGDFLGYIINKDLKYRSFDVKIAISVEKAKIEDENYSKLSKIGKFERIFGVFAQKTVFKWVKNLFGVKIRLRTYGFHKSGIIFKLFLFKSCYHLELCWKDKSCILFNQRFKFNKYF